MPTVKERCNLADEFADYFMGKIETIREFLKNFENCKRTEKSVPKFDMFEELSEDEIKKLITSFKQNPQSLTF